MKRTQCFVIKRGTDYDKAVKKHFELRPKWENVFNRVSELLGQKIERMAFDTKQLFVDYFDLSDDNKQLFTKDGRLKRNLNKSKEIHREYLRIIKDEGLTDFMELGRINFIYGVMRMQGQELEYFATLENDIYYKADFDLEKRSNGNVIPISEVEYQETYLNELKRREKQKETV